MTQKKCNKEKENELRILVGGWQSQQMKGTWVPG